MEEALFNIDGLKFFDTYLKVKKSKQKQNLKNALWVN